MLVPLLISCWASWSKINRLQEKVGASEIDHQKTLIRLEREIGELERAKKVLIAKARLDKEGFRRLERRLRILEIESPYRKATVEHGN